MSKQFCTIRNQWQNQWGQAESMGSDSIDYDPIDYAWVKVEDEEMEFMIDLMDTLVFCT